MRHQRVSSLTWVPDTLRRAHADVMCLSALPSEWGWGALHTCTPMRLSRGLNGNPPRGLHIGVIHSRVVPRTIWRGDPFNGQSVLEKASSTGYPIFALLCPAEAQERGHQRERQTVNSNIYPCKRETVLGTINGPLFFQIRFESRSMPSLFFSTSPVLESHR